MQANAPAGPRARVVAGTGWRTPTQRRLGAIELVRLPSGQQQSVLIKVNARSDQPEAIGRRRS